MKLAILAKLKERLGLSGPGIAVAVIAMVIPLAWAAFAAKLSSAQKKEVKRSPKSTSESLVLSVHRGRLAS